MKTLHENRGRDKKDKLRVSEIVERLEKEFSDAKIALDFVGPFELLVATILSAQCTDERVNVVTGRLFKKYRKPEDFANADLAELEEIVRPTGFYHNKAKNIRRSAQILVEKFNSDVPRRMNDLLELPGVARKTANVVLQNAYGIVEGVVVDTHVRRVATRLGLTMSKDQDKIEQDLMRVIPRNKWMRISDLLISLGRRVCSARKPKCGICTLNKLCPSAFTF